MYLSHMCNIVGDLMDKILGIEITYCIVIYKPHTQVISIKSIYYIHTLACAYKIHNLLNVVIVESMKTATVTLINTSYSASFHYYIPLKLWFLQRIRLEDAVQIQT